MTREQVFAAKEMYRKEIIAIAKKFKTLDAVDYDLDTTTLVKKIMRVTHSPLTIHKVINYYKHYVEMCMRVSYTLWEDEEQ